MLKLQTLLWLLTMASAGQLWAADPPLNVVFILVDDLGWTDLGCYGSDFYETPNIDRLAQQSVKFTQAYAAAPVCSPTRAAIMTGKFPARLGMTIWHEGAVSGGPKNRRLREAQAEPNLSREEVTLAELFRGAGYFTAHVGKWHLGTAAYYPETQGFDVNIGGTFWGAPSTFFYPFRGIWSKNDPQLRYVPGLAPGKEGDYLTDRLTDKALEIIEGAHDRPFFLNLWFHTVHTPIEGKPGRVRHFREKKPGQRHSFAAYAAMVSSLDENVGRLLQQLDKLNLDERTVVILASDNGGVDFETRTGTPTSNYPLRSGKGTLYEGGIRVPLLIKWPGRTRPGTVCQQPVSSEDFFPSLIDGIKELESDPDQMMDGVSLLPLLMNPDHGLDRQSLYWHYPHYYPRMTPASAVRRGDWKLIHYYEDDRLELYNLKDDVGEATNLADQHPQRTACLKKELDDWRIAVRARVPT